ncbi:MAG: aminopeptidase [Pseudomonadota bacterium]
MFTARVPIARLLVFCGLCLLLSGCATVSYYGQAVKGHWQITRGKEDIKKLLADPDLEPELKRRLETVIAIRSFAIDELLLPDSGSYTDFVDLERDVTLWLLSAAPAYSLAPRRWCYPFVGCFNYRGYFSRRQAEAERDRLAERGYDVALVPGLAYSTLGFANDPVLSTMLRYSDLQLAGVLFHELAHERLYVLDDSTFNESFATAVEKLGRQAWARQQQLGDVPVSNPQADVFRREFDELVLEVRGELELLYRGKDTAPAQQKAAIFDSFRRRHDALRDRWQGASPIDHWFEGEGPNNARLALFSTYELAVPAFVALFEQCERSWPCFYRAAEELAELPRSERQTRLDALGQQAPSQGQGEAPAQPDGETGR